MAAREVVLIKPTRRSGQRSMEKRCLMVNCELCLDDLVTLVSKLLLEILHKLAGTCRFLLRFLESHVLLSSQCPHSRSVGLNSIEVVLVSNSLACFDLVCFQRGLQRKMNLGQHRSLAVETDSSPRPVSSSFD